MLCYRSMLSQFTACDKSTEKSVLLQTDHCAYFTSITDGHLSSFNRFVSMQRDKDETSNRQRFGDLFAFTHHWLAVNCGVL